MKILLAAVNAKYIHSNLAVYTLQAYAKNRGVQVDIAEYTINQLHDDILRDLYEQKPDVLAISCYIWNIGQVKELITDFHKICPDVPIWLGGPEVSYEAVSFLEDNKEVTGIMCGEGEQTFTQLCKAYLNQESIYEIKGIVCRKEDGSIHNSGPAPLMNMDDIPFCYDRLSEFENRIIYYESSRGCPFRCSYCLSSIDKSIRFRSLALVKQELLFFLKKKVPQVKFVDRTFNANPKHAMEIWSFIKEHDNGVTNFHFEIAADILTREEMELLSTLRPALVQLEIGVQSTNEKTLEAIHRKTDLQKIWDNTAYIRSFHNIHQHLDLIAGLPFEDLESFKRSFRDVYAAKPDQLQLGFLKLLKGADISYHKEEYSMECEDRPPYEVLFTRWLPYQDVLQCKAVEEMVENYYNSGQFVHTLEQICRQYENPYDFYKELADYYVENGLNQVSHSRIERYHILRNFLSERFAKDFPVLQDYLLFDLYLREKVKSRPSWAEDINVRKEDRKSFYRQEKKERKYLPDYAQYDEKQLMRMTHLEYFSHDVMGSGEERPCVILFDYQKRNPLNREAHYQKIEEGVSER